MSLEIEKIKYCPREHIEDGCHGSVYSAKLENGIKWKWHVIKQDWEYDFIGFKVSLKEIKDSRYDIAEFLKVICFFIFRI
ncbi:hypothetical protein Glove_281g32 [Diversispora epigaea]|uniref:Uncharacterized protein n=1 Tax=Diversispora epigaea TaxID=1348612 RepID=A0A397I943_9GLOM|nr:hypothetical protein Glove_281g32 [Diversispora epigaea]